MAVFTYNVVKEKLSGFTLAELLIALSVLGIIATFTIPKILGASDGKQDMAIYNEDTATIATARLRLIEQNKFNVNTSPADILAEVNVVKNTFSTSFNVDDDDGNVVDCSSHFLYSCSLLQNGSVLIYRGEHFGGVTNGDGVWFMVDTDGKANGKTAGTIFLFYNGRLGYPGFNGSLNTSTGSVNLLTYPKPSWQTY